MYELVYDSIIIQEVIRKQFPTAIFEDARDNVHAERFSVEIESIGDDEFYSFAIKDRFVLSCLGFQLRMRDERYHKQIEGWIERVENDY